MSTLLSYVEHDDREIIRRFIFYVRNAMFYNGKLVLLGGDKYIKNKIINELSHLTKTTRFKSNQKMACNGKINWVDIFDCSSREITSIIKRNNLVVIDANDIPLIEAKYTLNERIKHNDIFLGGKVIILAKSLDLLKNKPYNKYMIIKLRKSKGYYIEQFKS